jgi:hypothetical protein
MGRNKHEPEALARDRDTYGATCRHSDRHVRHYRPPSQPPEKNDCAATTNYPLTACDPGQ